jgi:hypothetical protein
VQLKLVIKMHTLEGTCSDFLFLSNALGVVYWELLIWFYFEITHLKLTTSNFVLCLSKMPRNMIQLSSAVTRMIYLTPKGPKSLQGTIGTSGRFL